MIIDNIVNTTRELLESDWDQIQSIRDDDPDEKIKLTVATLICYKGDEQSIKTTLSFGMRKSDSRESLINPNQLEMGFISGNGDEPEMSADEPPETPEPKKRGRKPKAAA